VRRLPYIYRSGSGKCTVSVALPDLYECPTRAGHRQGQETAYFTRTPMRSAIAKTGGEPDNRTRGMCGPIQPNRVCGRSVTFCPISGRSTSAIKCDSGSIGVGAFRYSAALVPCTERELERLAAMWVQAYKCAWGVPWATASDVFTLPSVVAGMEYTRLIGIMAHDLCRHLQRCLKHEDVARQLTLRDLNLACEQWACGSVQELREETELWQWDLTLRHHQQVHSTPCASVPIHTNPSAEKNRSYI
jgi:hypothetical protein